MRCGPNRLRSRMSLAQRRIAGAAPTMRYGRQDEREGFDDQPRHVWLAWDVTLRSWYRFQDQGWYAALDPGYMSDMYGGLEPDEVNDVHLVFCRATYVNDTYMCWLYDGFRADGWSYLSGKIWLCEEYRPVTWSNVPLHNLDVGTLDDVDIPFGPSNSHTER